MSAPGARWFCTDEGISEFLLDLGVEAGGAPRNLFQTLVLLVAAVVLLDEDRRPPALLETLLLVVGPELGLDQDGRLGHLLIESVLKGQRGWRSEKTAQCVQRK